MKRTLPAAFGLAGTAEAGLIAGVDLDVPGNVYNDPNTPNTLLTEPGSLALLALLDLDGLLVSCRHRA